MGVPTFNSTEKALTLTIYDCILRIRLENVCYLTKVNPLDVELISMRHLLNELRRYTGLRRPKGYIFYGVFFVESLQNPGTG